jgi:hypothetical protein
MRMILKTIFNKIMRGFDLVGMFVIKIYQKFLSFDHSFWARPDIYRACIHYPSCSQYTYEAIDRHGLLKGSIMGFFRIIRCNPFSKGGIDPVPDKFSIRSS